MKVLAVCVLFAFAPLRLAAADVLPITQIIEEDGQFAFTDGNSYYLFNKDKSFRSEPLGESGRTINGHWKQQESTFVVEGKWGWINGTSKLNDFRRMRLNVYPKALETDANKRLSRSADVPAKLYQCYFVVNELVEIPQPQQEKKSPETGGLPVKIMNAVVTIDRRNTATLAFDVGGDADVTVAVKTHKGKVVTPLRRLQVQSGVEYKVRWNAKDNNAQPMPAGTYLFEINAAAHGTSHKVTKPIAHKSRSAR